MSEGKSQSSPERTRGVQLFNNTWELIGKQERTPDEDLTMVHMAHASAYHWTLAPECNSENRSISEWQVSHVYVLLNRSEPALFHALKSLECCESNAIGGFAHAYAHEAVARAAACQGNRSLCEKHYAIAQELGQSIIKDCDRKQVLSDLKAGPWFGMMAERD